MPSEYLDHDQSFTFTYGDVSSGINISGHVANANDYWQPVPGALVKFNSNAPVNALNANEHSGITGADGKFTLSDIPEDEFPGYITITKDGFEQYTSDEITQAQAQSGTIDLSNITLIPKEEPIPPSPNPTPEPTPVNNATVSGGTAQTGDDASVAFALLGLLMLAGSGVLIARKLYVK